jgi:hypothetical protein
MGGFFIWIYPRFAANLNDIFPRGGATRKFIVFPLKDVDYGSRENLAEVRSIGYLGLLLAAFLVGSMIWDFVRGMIAYR